MKTNPTRKMTILELEDLIIGCKERLKDENLGLTPKQCRELEQIMRQCVRLILHKKGLS